MTTLHDDLKAAIEKHYRETGCLVDGVHVSWLAASGLSSSIMRLDEIAVTEVRPAHWVRRGG